MALPDSPNATTTTSLGAQASSAASEHGAAFTVLRKSVGDALGAIGFSGVVAAFTSLSLYAINAVNPAFTENVMPKSLTPTGLLVSAGLSVAVGGLSMIASAAIKHTIDCEKRAHETCREQGKDQQIVLMPVQGVSISQAVEKEAETKKIDPETVAGLSKFFQEMIAERAPVQRGGR